MISAHQVAMYSPGAQTAGKPRSSGLPRSLGHRFQTKNLSSSSPHVFHQEPPARWAYLMEQGKKTTFVSQTVSSNKLAKGGQCVAHRAPQLPLILISRCTREMTCAQVYKLPFSGAAYYLQERDSFLNLEVPTAHRTRWLLKEKRPFGTLTAS